MKTGNNITMIPTKQYKSSNLDVNQLVCWISLIPGENL
jgi:hypothetical protein